MILWRWLGVNIGIVCHVLVFSMFAVGKVLPNDGTIAFEDRIDKQNLHIYLVDVSRSLIFSPTVHRVDNAAHPAWSLDGQWLAFTSERCDACGNDVFALNLETGELRQLTDVHGSINQYLRWSPDGQQIVLTGALDKSLADSGGIYVLDFESGHFQQLAFENVHNEIAPTWSPDGQQIAFKATPPREAYRLYVSNSDGNNLRSLALELDPWEDNITWSPDGQALVMSSFKDGIYVLQVDQQEITSRKISASGWSPMWSPDGKTIAFGANEMIWWSYQDYGGIYLVAPDGSDLHPVGRQDWDWIAQLSWSPDSHYLGFISYCGLSSQCIYVMDINSGETRPVIRYTSWRRPDEASLSWRP